MSLLVSVIIAHDVVRGNKELNRCKNHIEKSMRLAKVNGEIIVADTGTKITSRNSAAEKAKGDILVFIDDDAYPTESWMRELLRPFKSRHVGAVGGPNVLVPNSPFREIMADKILSSQLATWKSSSRYIPRGEIRVTDESELQLCNLAIRKSVFEKVGGFPDIIPGEENIMMENIQSAHFHLIYNPFAIVHHNRPALFIPYMKKLFFYGKGRGKMIRRYGRKGGIKFVSKSSVKSVFCVAVGLIVHYVSYISGLIWGYLKG